MTILELLEKGGDYLGEIFSRDKKKFRITGIRIEDSILVFVSEPIHVLRRQCL